MLYLYQLESGETKVYATKRARKGTMFLGGYSATFLQELLSAPITVEPFEEESEELAPRMHRIQEQEKRFGPCEDDSESACPFLEYLPEEHDRKLRDCTRDWSWHL